MSADPMLSLSVLQPLEAAGGRRLAVQQRADVLLQGAAQRETPPPDITRNELNNCELLASCVCSKSLHSTHPNSPQLLGMGSGCVAPILVELHLGAAGGDVGQRLQEARNRLRIVSQR